MLSKIEREYVTNSVAFEDKYGLDFAKVTRTRIRKKITNALNDITFVIKNDSDNRNPLRELRERRGEVVEFKRGYYFGGTKHQLPMFNHYNELKELINEYFNRQYNPMNFARDMINLR